MRTPARGVPTFYVWVYFYLLYMSLLFFKYRADSAHFARYFFDELCEHLKVFIQLRIALPAQL
jgi:hypothetical protein